MKLPESKKQGIKLRFKILDLFGSWKLVLGNSARPGERGIASLPAIILFGGLMVEIGLAGAFLIYYLNNSLYGTRLSESALISAQAGIEDGILKVVLDKSCPNASCSASYTITTDSGTADVVICRDSCSGAGTTQVTSTGKALTRRHKIVAILSVNSTTGLVTKQSVTEIPL